MHGVGGDDPLMEMWKGSVEFLKQADPTLAKIIEKMGGQPPRVRIIRDPFEALVRAIAHQAVRADRSSAIVEKMKAEFGGAFPRPAEILAGGIPKLTAVGLSRKQIGAIAELAKKVVGMEIDFDAIAKMNDADAIDALTQLPNVGPWTAEMYLIFHMGRQNVLMTGDVSLQNAIIRAYGLERGASSESMESITSKWDPWRSAAAWYVWSENGGLNPGLD